MTERNYWKEWWEHFTTFEQNCRRTWEYTKNYHGQTYAEWLEDLRKEWFEDMKNK